eukprot:c19402_g1_i1.p1 GENE.c19402_g1_i1~~c19402_g1_i1.p1  ORF type:complete len:368 (+),score=132.34 c19402_g1_i1:483-1586(+)
MAVLVGGVAESLPVSPRSPLVAILFSFVSTSNNIFDVVIFAICLSHGDVIWSSFLGFFLGLSTLTNLIIAIAEHSGNTLKAMIWSFLSLLQLKHWGDTMEYIFHPKLNRGTVLLYRLKKYLSCTIEVLPISSLLAYVLMLTISPYKDLFAACLFLSLATFAFGTTDFVACNEPLWLNVVAFLQVLSQLAFRLLVVCLLCAQFRLLGLFINFVFWGLCYLFGPNGTFSLWGRCVKEEESTVQTKNQDQDQPKLVGAICLSKFLISFLAFYVVVDPTYAPPENETKIKLHHCFYSNEFLLWRMFENVGAVIACLLVPPFDLEVMEDWAQDPILLLSVTVSCLFTIFTTWIIIQSQNNIEEEYLPQVDLS